MQFRELAYFKYRHKESILYNIYIYIYIEMPT